jgi:hypothetical protein
VASRLASPRRLEGAEASKARLSEALGARPELIHFATHAYFAGDQGCGTRKPGNPGWRDGDEPIAPNPLLLSGIVLAGANRPTRVDAEGQSGILTAYEVASLDLRSAASSRSPPATPEPVCVCAARRCRVCAGASAPPARAPSSPACGAATTWRPAG